MKPKLIALIIAKLLASHAELTLACPAYSFQTFSVGEVLAASKMNQIEVNIRDHVHGSSSVVNVPYSAISSVPAAADATAGVIETATQAEQETGTSVAVAVTPGRQHYHPSALKAWASVTVAAGTPTLQAGYNVASVTDHNPGDISFNFSTAFSSANFAVSAEAGVNTSGFSTWSKATTSFRVKTADAADPTTWDFLAAGDQ